MNISVIVLSHNDEDNISYCLLSILNQQNFKGDWEIIVVDGKSQDKTLKIVSEIQKKYSHIRIVVNKKIKISPGRNLGIKESRYPFIAFTDADCIVPGSWLSLLCKEFKKLNSEKKNIAGVGGGNIVLGQSKFQLSLGFYLDSYIGSFNSVQGRNFLKIKKVDSLACLNVLYNKQSLLKVGGFDESMGNVAEDLDLNLRLNKSGYSLYFIPNVPVKHKLRPDLQSWLKNMALYGRGRAMISYKHNFFFTPFFLLSFCFVLSFSLSLSGFCQAIFFFPFVYFPIIICYFLSQSIKKKKTALFFSTIVICISTHFVYSFTLFAKFLSICFKRVIKKKKIDV